MGLLDILKGTIQKVKYKQHRYKLQNDTTLLALMCFTENENSVGSYIQIQSNFITDDELQLLPESEVDSFLLDTVNYYCKNDYDPVQKNDITNIDTLIVELV